MSLRSEEPLNLGPGPAKDRRSSSQPFDARPLQGLFAAHTHDEGRRDDSPDALPALGDDFFPMMDPPGRRPALSAAGPTPSASRCRGMSLPPTRAEPEGVEMDVEQEQEEEEQPFAVHSSSSPYGDWDADHAGERVMLGLRQRHLKRYEAFVQAYFGLSQDDARRESRHIRTTCLTSVQLSKTSKQKRKWRRILAGADLMRHTVLAVEGDYAFGHIVARAAAESMAKLQLQKDITDQSTDSETCIALHYGFATVVGVDPAPATPKATEERRRCPGATLIAMVATGYVEKGEEIRLGLASYLRCLDEPAWYEQCCASGAAQPAPRGTPTPHPDAGNLLYGANPPRGVKVFCRWPAGLRYYHGVGQRHASDTPQATFPFTLLSLQETPEIGPGELGVCAAAPVAYSTCFIYGGSVATLKQVKRWNEDPGLEAREGRSRTPSAGEHGITEDLSDDTYALGLDEEAMCYGQSLTRYINHRYNLSRFGNVELCSVTLSLRCSAAGTPLTGKKSRTPAERGTTATIPFFIATTDIEAGSPLLAWSYGEEYDAKLERQAVADGLLVSHMDAAVLNQRLGTASPSRRFRQRYPGDYRYAIRVGDVVWRRSCAPGSPGAPPPWEELYVVAGVPARGTEFLLLRPLLRRYLPAARWSALLEREQVVASTAQLPYAGHKRGRHRSPSLVDGFALFAVDQSRLDESAPAVEPKLVVVPSRSVALLLCDVDYVYVSEDEHLRGLEGGSKCFFILLDLHLLERNTAAVRASPPLLLPPVQPLIHSSMWPALAGQMAPEPKNGARPSLLSASRIQKMYWIICWRHSGDKGARLSNAGDCLQSGMDESYRPWYCHRVHGKMARHDSRGGYTFFTHLEPTDCDCTPPLSPCQGEAQLIVLPPQDETPLPDRPAWLPVLCPLQPGTCFPAARLSLRITGWNGGCSPLLSFAFATSILSALRCLLLDYIFARLASSLPSMEPPGEAAAGPNAWDEYWDRLLRHSQLGPRTHPAYTLSGNWGNTRYRQRRQALRMRQRLLRGLVSTLPGQEVLFLTDGVHEETEARVPYGTDFAVLPPSAADDATSLPPPVAAVFDSGHLTDPVLLCDERALAAAVQDGGLGLPVNEQEVVAAVLVQPLVEEVLLGQAETPAPGPGAFVFCGSVGSRYREWQRQKAIRVAVGVTSQEALIDLKIDPRYRRPGEYLRRHHGIPVLIRPPAGLELDVTRIGHIEG
eukprot:gene9125-6413_t